MKTQRALSTSPIAAALLLSTLLGTAVSPAQNAQPTRPIVSIDFDGGSLEDFVEEIRGAGENINILIPPEASEVTVPAVSLKSVGVEAALEAVATITLSDTVRVRVSTMLGAGVPIYAVRVSLASLGLDESAATHYPQGGLRWRAESDKQGFESVTPLSGQARVELDRYLAKTPRLGDVPLFPAPTDPSKPIRKDLAGDWLMKAERLAKQPKLRGTRWHGYRRLFATELKSVPVQDVAAAGGWKSIETVQRLYQQAEPSGVLSAIERVASSGEG